MNHIIKYLIQCFLEVLYPSAIKCLGCDIEEDESFLCNECNSKLSYVNSKFYLGKTPCYSIFYYNNIMKKLISEFKYKKNFNVGEFFLFLLCEKIKSENISFDYVTFIPMNKLALKKRGFNQCEYLAKKIAENTDKKLIDILGKKDGVKEQKTLSRTERADNIKDAFYVKYENLDINNKRVLLIDDVITSGETLINSVKTLKEYYNIEIFLLTVVKSSI